MSQQDKYNKIAKLRREIDLIADEIHSLVQLAGAKRNLLDAKKAEIEELLRRE